MAAVIVIVTVEGEEDVVAMNMRRIFFMAGRWDESDGTLHGELKRAKYFDAEELIQAIAKEGIEMNKLSEHFSLDEGAKETLIDIINVKVDRMDGMQGISDTIMGFLKGYDMGITEASVDKKVIDL